MKTSLIIIASITGWLLIFGGVYTAAYMGLGAERLDTLKNSGKRTEGVVVVKKPDEHQSVIYYYSVDGIKYTGSGGTGNGNPEFAALNVGDPVIVTYEEQSPLNSIMGIPDPERDRDIAYILAFFVATAVIGQILAVFLIIRYIRKSRRRSAP